MSLPGAWRTQNLEMARRLGAWLPLQMPVVSKGSWVPERRALFTSWARKFMSKRYWEYFFCSRSCLALGDRDCFIPTTASMLEPTEADPRTGRFVMLLHSLPLFSVKCRYKQQRSQSVEPTWSPHCSKSRLDMDMFGTFSPVPLGSRVILHGRIWTAHLFWDWGPIYRDLGIYPKIRPMC